MVIVVGRTCVVKYKINVTESRYDMLKKSRKYKMQCSCTLLVESDSQHHRENVALCRWPPSLPPVLGHEM